MRIQSLNLVEDGAEDPMQLPLEDAQTYPRVVKVFEKC